MNIYLRKNDLKKAGMYAEKALKVEKENEEVYAAIQKHPELLAEVESILAFGSIKSSF